MDAQFESSCEKFKDYSNIDEYAEDVIKCLMCSSWQYTEAQARELVADEIEYVEESFGKKVPAADIYTNIGYVAG